MTYKVKSKFIEKGLSSFDLGTEVLKVDVSKARDENLPGPAELLLTALSSCILKNVERFSEILKFYYEEVRVEMEADRQEFNRLVFEKLSLLNPLLLRPLTLMLISSH